MAATDGSEMKSDDIEDESSDRRCFDGTNANADSLSFRFRLDETVTPLSDAGFHGSVRGEEDEELTPNDVFSVTSVFLSILVTILPISATCFCKSEMIEKR